jgi:hypothetical protein
VIERYPLDATDRSFLLLNLQLLNQSEPLNLVLSREFLQNSHWLKLIEQNVSEIFKEEGMRSRCLCNLNRELEPS